MTRKWPIANLGEWGVDYTLHNIHIYTLLIYSYTQLACYLVSSISFFEVSIFTLYSFIPTL